MNDLITYSTDHGEVQLSAQIVKNYLVPANSKVTDAEIYLFMQLCKRQGLDPFLREVYLVKFGDYAASMVTGKEVFTKRAERHPKYAGKQAGITIICQNGMLERRIGSLILDGETLVGGWGKVYLNGHAVPDEIEVSLAEYTGVGPLWKSKPCTMIRKVALVQALREAFPEEFEGLYSQEEINTIDSSTLPTAPVTGYTAIEPTTAPTVVQHDVPAPATPVTPSVVPVLQGTNGTVVAKPTGTVDYGALPLNFGSKHKGKTIREVAQDEASYLTWVVEKSNAADETKNNIRSYLASMKVASKPVIKPVMKDVTPPDYGEAPPIDDSQMPLPFDI
jgi:phage recombination protein Bet